MIIVKYFYTEGNTTEPEVAAVMAWTKSRPFSLSVALQAGALHVTYPYTAPTPAGMSHCFQITYSADWYLSKWFMMGKCISQVWLTILTLIVEQVKDPTKSSHYFHIDILTAFLHT